jgi:hypothetical protein
MRFLVDGPGRIAHNPTLTARACLRGRKWRSPSS